MSISNTDSHVSALRIFVESLERIVAKEVVFLCSIFFVFLCLQWHGTVVTRHS